MAKLLIRYMMSFAEYSMHSPANTLGFVGPMNGRRGSCWRLFGPDNLPRLAPRGFGFVSTASVFLHARSYSAFCLSFRLDHAISISCLLPEMRSHGFPYQHLRIAPQIMHGPVCQPSCCNTFEWCVSSSCTFFPLL